MKMLDKFVQKVGNDKLLHFLVAYAMTATGAMYSIAAGAVTAASVLILSVIKELWLDDYADWNDAVAAITGCGCCIACKSLIVYL